MDFNHPSRANSTVSIASTSSTTLASQVENMFAGIERDSYPAAKKLTQPWQKLGLKKCQDKQGTSLPDYDMLAKNEPKLVCCSQMYDAGTRKLGGY